jgi:ketosteroid isomerase-like protein
MATGAADVVRDIFAATNEGDFIRALGHYADDATLVVVGGITPGTYEGKQAVGEWFGEWLLHFERGYRFEERDVRELADGLIFLRMLHRGTGRVSGVAVEAQSDYLFRVSHGKVTRVGVFFAPHDALEPSIRLEWSDPENG